MYILFEFLVLLLFLKATFGCIGGVSTSYTLASRNRALAAHNLDLDMQSAKCEVEYGTYTAKDLRRLATIYDFVGFSTPIKNGGSPFCNFDSEWERCSWHNQQVGLGHGFQRARFESFFDLNKFECSSDRIFEFRDYFLMAGAEDNDRNVSAAIETRISCQLEKAYLKFDYWTNSDTPVLKVCVIVDNQLPSCEESKMDINPLTFEVPASLTPFKLRIQVEEIGREDIVLLDSVRYESLFCEIGAPNTTDEMTLSTSTTSAQLSQKLVDSISAIIKKHKLFGTSNAVQNQETGKHLKMSICEALSCDFNHGDSCFYSLSGFGGTAEWRVGEGNKMGNPHTGIRHPNAIDLKMTGFVFVGLDGNDFTEEIFVMESPTFVNKEAVYLVFDLYLRSKGPQLRVCINSFQNCPYISSPLAVNEFWRTDQRILLDEEAEQVFFVAGKVGRNLYLAVDNIRIQNTNFGDYCNDMPAKR